MAELWVKETCSKKLGENKIRKDIEERIKTHKYYSD